MVFKASRSTDSFLLHWTTNIWGLPWKILKTVEPLFLYIISLENNIPAIGLFWQWSATTVLRPRDTHVANDDLSVSSQNSIEIHSRDIVFCRLETDNCAHFLLGRRFNSSCWPVFALFWNFWSVLFKCCFVMPCFFVCLFFYFNIFLPEGQDKIHLSHPVTARALSLKIWVFIFIANTLQRVETKNMLNKS